MEQPDFPGNRLGGPAQTPPKKEEEDKNLQPIVTGDVIRRKKGIGRRIKETFTGGETDQGVFDYVFFNVALPAAKDLIFDAFTEGLQRQLFPDRTPGRRTNYRSGGFGSGGYVSYSRQSAPGAAQQQRYGNTPEPRNGGRRRGARVDFGEIVIPSRVEAMDVLDRMGALVDQYDLVTLSDLYVLLNEPVTPIDNNWGWTSLHGSSIRRVNGGYLLVLPDPQSLN